MQIVDAARLVFVPWPGSLTLPPQAPPETWRNRLAYTIFDAELALGPDDQLPWAMLGVPVGLVAFDSAWKPLFIDCASVARQGGLPRRNYLVPVGTDEAPSRARPELLQARITQLAEQLSQRLNGAVPLRNLSDAFATAPPSGIVPAAAVDFVNKKNVWFPPNWALKAGPVHLEELETVLQTGITASPIAVQATAPADKTLLEPIEILVPLPDELYDPKILITETVSEEFQAEIDLATADRNRTLKKRKAEQLETNALITALGTNVPAPNPNLINLNDGLTPAEIVACDSPLPYFPFASTNTAVDESFGVAGPASWQPSSPVVAGQFIVDRNRNIQVSQKAALSANTEPTWNTSFSGITAEAVTTATNTQAAVAAGSNVSITVSGSGGFQVGMQLLIDTGANQEQFAVTVIADPTHITADKLAKAHASGVFIVSNVNWINNGPVTLGSTTWQPNSSYLAGQFILDSNGNLQTVQAAGISGATEPAWATNAGAVTQDGTLKWTNGGPGRWQANQAYKAGQFVIDPKGNIQTVQADGTSGASQPAWQATPLVAVASTTTTAAVVAGSSVVIPVKDSTGFRTGQQLTIDTGANQESFTVTAVPDATHLTADTLTQGHVAGVTVASNAVTPDNNITWINNGQSTWQKKTAYVPGQFIVDHNGNLQIVTGGGTSGDAPPKWATALGRPTAGDGGVTWTNASRGRWQADASYTVGQFIFDRNGNLQVVQLAGTTGATEPQWSIVSGQPTHDGAAPGGVTWVVKSWNSTDFQGVLRYPSAFAGAGSQFPLCTAADQQDLFNNGLQHFIDHMNSKISKADDLINLAFLTAQTDIYRYRQNVLGATGASKLATSPILANIATGDTAAVVSENLQNFLNTLPSTKAPTPFPTPTPATPTGAPANAGPSRVTGLRSAVLATPMRNFAPAPRSTPASTVPAARQLSTFTMNRPGSGVIGTTFGLVQRLNGATPSPTSFKPIVRGTASSASTVGDVTQQQPLWARNSISGR